MGLKKNFCYVWSWWEWSVCCRYGTEKVSARLRENTRNSEEKRIRRTLLVTLVEVVRMANKLVGRSEMVKLVCIVIVRWVG